MLQDRNILCMSNPSWAGNYAKAVVEMMRVLARNGNKILYVENPYTWIQVFRTLGKGRLLEAFQMIFSSTRCKKYRVEEFSVLVFNPGPVLPINFLPRGPWYNLLMRWNNNRIKRLVRKVLKKQGMEERLIHINAFNPLVAKGTAGEFNEETLIYYCYDEIRSAKFLHRHGSYLEPWLMSRVDFTFVSSDGLKEAKSSLSNKIHVIKNGVDYELFKQGFRSQVPEKKKVGYIGSIDDRLDLDLLKKLFEHFPETEFEFVGRVNDPEVKEFLSAHPQVLLAGAHPYTELHVFLSRYAVGIIPFVKNSFTAGIYPLKINEYLATGLPVVSTNFSKLSDFNAVASICDTDETFIESIEKYMSEDSAELRDKRKNFAALNSWERRAEKLSELITNFESHDQRA